MKKNQVWLLSVIFFLVGLCSYSTVSQAVTTEEYYLTHGNFQPNSNSVEASDWASFIEAYQNEEVTKIILVNDIEDNSRNGASGPANYQRKSSIEIDGQGHILTLKQYHGLRTSEEAIGYTELADGIEVPRSIFHMHDISLRQNLGGVEAFSGHYSSFSFVGASDVHASWGLESAKYEQNMTKNWYFRFGNIDTKNDNNEDNAKGVARLVMAYGAEVSVYGQLDLSTSAENMYVGSLIVEDETSWTGTVEHYNYSTVWFAIASQPNSTGRSEELTIGKNSQIKLLNIKHGTNFPGFYGHYKNAVIGENSQVEVQNKGVAWQFEQDGSSLVIQNGAKLELNSLGKGKILQFGRGFLSPSKIKDSQLVVKSGGALVINGETTGPAGISVIDFSGGLQNISSTAYTAINSSIVVEPGAIFDVKNSTKSKNTARKRAINLRQESNQLKLENNSVSLWTTETPLDQLDGTASVVLPSEANVIVKGEKSHSFKIENTPFLYQNKDFRRITTIPTVMDPIEDNEAPSIEINTPEFKEDYANTQERTITIEGTASDNHKIKEVTYQIINSEDQAVKTGKLTGKESWKIEEVELELGINKLVVGAVDFHDNKAEATKYLKRLNDELHLADNVVAISAEDEKKLNEQFISQRMDDNETPGYIYDDQLIMTFIKDNEFSKSIEAGYLDVGKILYFDHSEYMPGGYTGKLVEIKTEGDKISYHFEQPELIEVFQEDISLDYDQEINTEKDILYVLSPNIEEEKSVSRSNEKKEHFVNTDEFFSFISPHKETDGDTAQITIGNTKNGLVLYDIDGDRSTKQDQVSLLMEAGLKNFKIDTALEWKKVLKGPEQIRFKTDWKNEASFGLKFGGKKGIPLDKKVDLTTVIKKLKKAIGADFKNEMKYASVLTVKGVDSLNDSIVLGFIGVNINPLTKQIKVVAKKSLAGAIEDSGASTFVKFTPTLGVMMCLDIKGEVKLTGSALYKQANKYTKGINIQKEGYVGKGGSVEKNRGDNHKEKTFNKQVFNFDYYDSNTKDKGKTTFDFEGAINTKVGGGPAIGLLINGIIPVSASAKVSADFEMKMKEKIEIDHNEPDITIELGGNVDFSVNRDVNVEAKLAVEPGGSLEGKYTNPQQIFYFGTKMTKPLVATLTWKKTPRDLDSYLFTPDGQLMYYSNKVIKNKAGEIIAALDYDYMGGFGPEKTEIYPKNMVGAYKFSVKQYSKEDQYQIKKSKAQVVLTRDGDVIGTYTCPTKGEGEWWHVFDYDTKTGLSSINKITDRE